MNRIKNLPVGINTLINTFAADKKTFNKVISEIPDYVKYTYTIHEEKYFLNYIQSQSSQNELLDISELFMNINHIGYDFLLTMESLLETITTDNSIILVDNQNCACCDIPEEPDIVYTIKQQASEHTSMKLYKIIPVILQMNIIRRCYHNIFEGIHQEQDGTYTIIWGS